MLNIQKEIFRQSLSTSRFSALEFVFEKQRYYQINNEIPNFTSGDFKIYVVKSNNFEYESRVSFYIVDEPLKSFNFDLDILTEEIGKKRIFIKENKTIDTIHVDFSIKDSIIFDLLVKGNNLKLYRIKIEYATLKEINKLPIYDGLSFISFLNKII